MKKNGQISEIEYIFWIGSRMCVIKHIGFEMPNIQEWNLSIPNSWRCGYVESNKTGNYDSYYKYGIDEEPTFGIGPLKNIEDKKFIGFDANHLYDHEHPELVTLEAMKLRLKRFAEQIIIAEEILE